MIVASDSTGISTSFDNNRVQGENVKGVTYDIYHGESRLQDNLTHRLNTQGLVIYRTIDPTLEWLAIYLDFSMKGELQVVENVAEHTAHSCYG